MNNKLFSLILAGIMLSGAAQGQMSKESAAFGFLAGLGANAIGNIAILKIAEKLPKNLSATDTTLAYSIFGIAQIALPTASFWLYKKISGDDGKKIFGARFAFSAAGALTGILSNCSAADDHSVPRVGNVAMMGIVFGLLGNGINLLDLAA